MLYQRGFCENSSIIENMGKYPIKFNHIKDIYNNHLTNVRVIVNKIRKKQKEVNGIRNHRDLQHRHLRVSRNNINKVTRQCNTQHRRYKQFRNKINKSIKNLRNSKHSDNEKQHKIAAREKKLHNRLKRLKSSCKKKTYANKQFNAYSKRLKNINKVFHKKRKELYELSRKRATNFIISKQLKKQYNYIFNRAKKQCLNNSHPTNNNMTNNNMKKCARVYDDMLRRIVKYTGSLKKLMSVRRL
jgi:chromosome segregation ATPase